jgi:hypothetical protein
MDIHELIEMFNDGDTDFIQYVNDIETFLKIVNKRGLIDELDPDGKLSEHYQNELLLFYYENNEEKFWEYVLKYLGDVELVNGEAYLVVDNQGELAELFCSGNRNDISKDTVEAILSGEYDSYDGWSSYDLTDNVYRDVIEELTKENILHLKEYIIKTLEGKQIEPYTELLEDYAQQQGHPEYVTIDQSNIDQVVDNEETMKELMNNSELEDLKSELYGIYGSAYNSAYEDELYEDVWGVLSTYFGEGEWVTRPHIYKKDTEVQKFRTPIHNFESNIFDFLQENKGISYGTLEYWGSYLGMLKNEIDCLSVYAPDYPDSRKVDKNINMSFNDYI